MGPPPKQSSNQTQEKRVDQGDTEKVAEVEEVNTNVQNFNFENELSKIKIPVPFIELMKNPSYRNPVLKMLGSSASQIPSDTMNLQEEYPKIFMVLL